MNTINARKSMLRLLPILVLIVAIPASFSCKKKDRNLVPIEQIESDGSSNYKEIFKRAVEEERRQDGRFKKNEFRD
ncbi:MAG TPA: hypothetical protein PKY31_00540 [Spirochaetota bacterium]|nr:hypothetical protein [Spirochaetota bacterium]